MPLVWTLDADVVRPRPGVVLFVCDGLGADLVEQGVSEGWLPNVQRRFVDGGVWVRPASTSIPAVTYSVMTTLLTGVGPGRHGIAGNRWFDPRHRLFRDYEVATHYADVNTDFDAPTIYERIAPATSVSIQAAHARGVSYDVANWAMSGVMWLFRDYTAVDKLTAASITAVADYANARRRWPTLLTCYFPGADSVGHQEGASSAQYRAAVEHLDYQIGRICDGLEEQGLLETTYLVLVADHGMVDVRDDGHLDLTGLVRDGWGRNATDVMLQDAPECERRRFYDQFDTVAVYQNGRSAFLFFRGPSGWDERPAAQAVAEILTAPPPELQLWSIPGIELVAYLAAEDEVVLRTSGGESRVRTRDDPRGPQYAYVPQPDDVLGYLADPDLAAFVAAGYYSPREWLAATGAQTLPDVVPHLIPLLRAPHVGEVVAFAKPGYSFLLEKGGHGGLNRDEVLIPFLVAGPGLPAGTSVGPGRAVDLAPTLLTLLGLPLPEDGLLEGAPVVAVDAAVSSESFAEP